MSPAQILMLFEQSEKELAQVALQTLEVVHAATGVGWLKKGLETYLKLWQRLARLAGYDNSPAKRTDDVKANRKKLTAMFSKLGIIRK